MKLKLLWLMLIMLILVPLMSACVSTDSEVISSSLGGTLPCPMPPLSEGQIPTGWTCKHIHRRTRVSPDNYGYETLETWECHWE